jgi:VWFA-related protein
MRAVLAVLPVALALALLPSLVDAQVPGGVPYKLTPLEDPKPWRDGSGTLQVTVRFTIEQLRAVQGDEWKHYKVKITENGRQVKEVGMPKPVIGVQEDLSVVFALDVSGSMVKIDGSGKNRRIDEARKAAEFFLNQLPARAPCGLILFDHEMKRELTPRLDRGELIKFIKAEEPSGGTAYLDATFKGIGMLRQPGIKGKRVVVVATDGIDLNSRVNLERVIAEANATEAGAPSELKVKVYTIGIGEPGKKEKVTSVLALDTSGSMLQRADDRDEISKIDALKTAALKFVRIMRPGARGSLLEFNDTLQTPKPFTGDKVALAKDIEERISEEKADGETAFLDATYTAVASLIAENPEGKRAVVVLTDGVDNSSRRRKEEVIDLARSHKIKIFMLGLGRSGELDQKTMEEIADKTGGYYDRASNMKKLIELFEKLSTELHDEGVDEDSLRRLAKETGGEYHLAKDAAKLKFVLKDVGAALMKPRDYTETFESKFQDDDGTRRKIGLSLVFVERDAKGRVREVDVGGGPHVGDVQVRGVVVARMDSLVYVGMLGLLGVLLALPPAMRRMTGKGGS